MILVSKPRVIKVLPKSDISIIWIDIWNVQSGSRAKDLINQCFNIGKYIATIQGTIWTPEYCNARIARNRDTQHSHVESKVLNTLNAMNHTSQKTIVNLDGAVRKIRRQTLCTSKWKEKSCVYTCSNTPTVGVITKLIQISVHSGDIGLTESGTRKNILRSMRTDPNQFIQSWMATPNYNR